jgi:hypothetical protein
MIPVLLKPFVYFGATSCGHNFFFLPSWWEFLPNQPNPQNSCEIIFNFPHDALAVGLAVLDMLLRIGGFVAVVSLIVAGVQYITSGGNVDNATNARKRIVNTLIGLAIVLIATGVVAFIGNQIGG